MCVVTDILVFVALQSDCQRTFYTDREQRDIFSLTLLSALENLLTELTTFNPKWIV